MEGYSVGRLRETMIDNKLKSLTARQHLNEAAGMIESIITSSSSESMMLGDAVRYIDNAIDSLNTVIGRNTVAMEDE
jgi:hypothetical protein